MHVLADALLPGLYDAYPGRDLVLARIAVDHSGPPQYGSQKHSPHPVQKLQL